MYRVNLNMCFTVSFLEWGSGGGIHTQCIGFIFNRKIRLCFLHLSFFFGWVSNKLYLMTHRTSAHNSVFKLGLPVFITAYMLYVWLLSLIIYEWLSKPQLCGARCKTWSFLVSSIKNCSFENRWMFPAILLRSSITQTDFFFWLIKKTPTSL